MLLIIPASSANDVLEAKIKRINVDVFPSISFIAQMPADARFTNKAIDQSGFRLTENGVEVTDSTLKALNPKTERGATVLLIDNSGSMKGQALEDAKSALKAFIDLTKTNEQIAIYSFNKDIAMLSDFNSDRTDLAKAIDAIVARGDTRLNDALVMASEVLKKQQIQQRHIVVLTDGKDTTSTADNKEAQAALYESGAFVSAVALIGSDYDPEFIRGLCDSTGGSFVETPDSASLTELYRQLAMQIYNQYEVTFQSLNPQTSELRFNITVQAKGAQALGSATLANPGFSTPASVSNMSKEEAKPLKVIRDAAGRSVSIMVGWPGMLIMILSLLAAFTAIAIIAGILSGLVIYDRTTLRKQAQFIDERSNGLNTVRQQKPRSGKGMAEEVLLITDKIAKRRGYTQVLSTMLERADIPIRVPEFIVMHVGTIAVIGSLAALLIHNKVFDFVVITAIAMGPLVYIQRVISKKQKKFEEHFPDTLRVIASSLRSGHSFAQAIEVVAGEDIPEVSPEFKKVSTETKLGLPLEQALENLASRVGSENVYWMVLAIKVQREVGGNLAEILDVLANTIQERDAVQRQIRTLTAEGRISAAVLILLPFFLTILLLIVNPNYLAPLYTTIPGFIMLLVTVMMLIAGIIWLRNIIRIEV